MVFCIWILVVVHGLSQTLKNKDYANTQIKSAFFAREWIELVFNLRDANYHKELPWNCIFEYSDNGIELKLDDKDNEIKNSACSDYLWSWDFQVLKISMWSGEEYIHVESTNNVDIQNFTWMFNDYQIIFYYIFNFKILNKMRKFFLFRLMKYKIIKKFFCSIRKCYIIFKIFWSFIFSSSSMTNILFSSFPI